MILVDVGNFLKCVSSLEGVYVGGILSIKVGSWWLVVGVFDNIMLFFYCFE